jgi:hypothetical protein
MKNHTSLSVNLYWIKISTDTEIKSGNWSYSVKYSKSQPLRVNAEARSNVTTLMVSKEMIWQESILCKLELKKYILYLILSVGLPLYQEGYHMDCQQSLNAQHSPKTQVRWVKHNYLIHSTSHWTLENKMFQFPKLEHPVYAVTTLFQILDVPILKPDAPIFTG